MGTLLNRRRYMGNSGGELPAGYRLCEYIQSNGRNYINTGILPDNTIEYDVTFSTDNKIDSTGYGCIFGCRKSSGNNDFQVTTYTANSRFTKGTVRFGNNSQDNVRSAGIVLNTKLTASLHGLVYTCNDSTLNLDTYNWNDARNIYLFGLNNNNSFAQSGNGCIIYSAKFKLSGDLVRDYIPVQRISDDKYGLYDMVNNTFNISPNGIDFSGG